VTQIILLEDEKKMTIYNISQNSSSLAHALESGDWDPPDGMAEKFDPDEMCMLEMPNFVVGLPKDYQWKVQPMHTDEEVILSPRQQQVLQALAEGFTTKQIAYNLGISQRTVMAHIQATKERFGTYTRAQTVSRAQSLGLIQAEQ
jgi:DNA-binding CsgD family transcriptional regulator